MPKSLLRSADMKGFRALIPQSKLDQVLSALHEAGAAQFREISQEEIEREELEEGFYEINSIMGRMEEIQDFFNTTDKKTTYELEDESLENILDSTRDLLEEVEPKKEELASEKRRIEEKREEYHTQKNLLSFLEDIDVPLNYFQSTEKIEILSGKIDEDELDEFMENVRENLSEKVFVTSFGVGGTRIVVLVCRKEVVSDLRPILYRFGVEMLELPQSDKTPKQFLEELDDKLENLKEEEKQIDEKIEKIKERKAPEINALTEYLEIEVERLECLPLFGRTESTTIIEGWTLEEELTSAEEAIKEATEQSYIMRTYEPSELDVSETPIELENPKFVDGFEWLTHMYGLPRYDSTEPTLIVALTFSIFFGFTLSDAGYGLVILAFLLPSLAMIKDIFSNKLAGIPLLGTLGPYIAGARHMFRGNPRKVMIAGGLGTILAGALFGSWFGGKLGELVSVFSPLWVNPIREPIPFLKLVVFFGVLQLAIGYGIGSGRKNILRGNWRKVILEDIGNALLIIGLFLLVFCVVGMGLKEFGINYFFPKLSVFDAFNPLAGGTTLVFAYKGIFFTGLIMAVLGNLTAEGAPMMDRIGGAVNTVYSIIDFISNVVSYTRLLALGIATSVIALVINKIGLIIFGALYPATFSGALSYVLGAVGIIILLVVLVLGHLFNVFINTITGFVHTMRLHYAEFFQTFYEAGGEKYSPFKLIRKYT
ncbi:hypothetical protein AKJ36_00785 [candidate division MSBL1 archaeon SCGC-AAA259I07]|uniref:A-type ATP synthase subunit I n=1 Tax=candidate division MSBL1 archaeon SCGC-AAA259I07 TaxID=1698266 RepID=A0A133UMN0_9EURY|nr:hypothetical protein AKJ36_00785 [candidate division MSBL1 archaeon SCGC-AAA259I07]